MTPGSLFDGSEGVAPRPRERAKGDASPGTPSIEPAALSVSELVQKLKTAVEPSFSGIWVAGEIADFRGIHGSGHAYFALKEGTVAAIKAKMWRTSVARLRFPLEEGAAVLAHGSIDVWAPRGELSLIVDRIVPVGIGEAAAAFEKLRRKLLEEGLFAEERKRPIPNFPRAIGLVTSREGAALRDFLRHLSERFPVRVVLAASAVQGESAPESVAAAIERLSSGAEILGIDAVAIVRGGGGIEDLAAFNTEMVARAIAACSVPVVTGIGHEIDTTIADLVADRRAKTPTDAANVLAPDRETLWTALEDSADRLSAALDRIVSEAELECEHLGRASLRAGPGGTLARLQAELDRLGGRLRTSSPRLLLAERRRRLDATAAELVAAARRRLTDAEGAVALAAARLEGASPVAILARGYSLARKAGSAQFLTDSRAVAPGDQVETRLSRGSFVSRVEAVRADGEGP
jgi:exodeoxyribonuclease VII large subunit